MKPQSKIFTITALSLLVLSSAAAWAYLAHKGNAYKSEIASITAEIKKESDKETSLLSIRLALREEKEDVDLINGQFIDKENIPAFITSLENLATTTGVKAVINSVNLPDSKDKIVPLRIDISGSGLWENVVRFAATLDSYPKASRLENLSFAKGSRQDDDKGAPLWNFNASFIQYIAQ